MAEITIHLDSALCECRPISYSWTLARTNSLKPQQAIRLSCSKCGVSIQLPASSGGIV